MRGGCRHTDRADADEAEGPCDVEVEPCFRQEFQAEPEIHACGEEASGEHHGGCVCGGDSESGFDVVAHQGGCGLVAGV